MLYNLLRDIIVLSLTFIVNFLIVSTFWGLVEVFSPIHWQWLQKGMNYFSIPFTETNVIIVLSDPLPAVPYPAHAALSLLVYELSGSHRRRRRTAEAGHVHRLPEGRIGYG